MKTYNPDGLVEHRGPRAKRSAPGKSLTTLLEEAVARDDVRSAVAVWLGLPATVTAGEVVKTAVDRDFLLNTIDYARKVSEQPPVIAWPAFLATYALFTLWAGGMPHVPTEDQARAFRHLTHQTLAAGPRETSPIRLKPTAVELRHRDAVRRWWS